VDVADLHGGLLALIELASAYRDTDRRGAFEVQRCEVTLLQIRTAQSTYLLQTFRYLGRIPQDILQSSRNELVASAACQLIANSISLAEIQLDQNSSVPHWRKIVNDGLKHRAPSVQEAAAEAMAAVSKLTDCSLIVKR
jgi:hypothetical protein